MINRFQFLRAVVRRTFLTGFLPSAYPIVRRPAQCHNPIFADYAHKLLCYEIALLHVYSLCAYRFTLRLESIESL